jgi:hypothetical protein
MSRYYSGSSEEHQPVTWLRGYPIFAAHFVVLVFVISMIATAVLMAARGGALLAWLPFESDRVLSGEVWRVLSYGLINPPDLWFVIDMFMIVWFGRELEKFFGRRTFFFLYGGIYLLTPLLFTAIGYWAPTRIVGQQGAFALFIAFATLFPNIPLLFNILAKWAAAILIGINSLAALANHQWTALITLWVTSGFAFLFVRFHQGQLVLPRLRLPSRKPKLRVLPDPKPARTARTEKPAYESALKPDASMAEIDALLDKIAVSGISSLTPKERAKLEAAREGLLKRSGSRE